MFLTTTVSDLIQIKPVEFEKSSIKAIKDAIHAKYANKVIQEVGLCICLRDILKSSEGLIGHGSGIVNVNGACVRGFGSTGPFTVGLADRIKVDFRLVVFRPFKGEIIEGRITGSTAQGIKIALDFFDDIFVPGPVNLFEGTKFVGQEQVWVWTTESGDELFFDNEETVRFRVEAEIWTDQSPQAPTTDDTPVERKSPYGIIGSMQQAGLGPILWWEEGAEEE